jgi:predicted heme/steroid binding protein
MLSALRLGDWLTAERLRVIPRILLALSALAVTVWVGVSDGMVDPRGKPLGTDFSKVYAAGELALSGRPETAWDRGAHFGAQQSVFGADTPYYGWHYPPVFLFAAAGLAMLPYGWALFAWMTLTLPLYLATLRTIVPRPETLILALAFPAVFVTLGHGQNGFVTAALIGGGLLLLDRRPIAAGVLFGLMVYKPQFGLLIPLALAMSGRWRAFVSAAVTVLAACAASLTVFGMESWIVFIESTGFTREAVLESGATGWHKIQSLFAAVRMWGGSVGLAYAAQAVLGIAVAASLAWLWRDGTDFALKAAGLACASMLATPYMLDYDLVVLGVAIAFLTRHGLEHGFRDYEITGLAAAWVAPLVARNVFAVTGIPLGLLAMLTVYALTLRCAALETTDGLGSSIPSSARHGPVAWRG